MADRTVSSRERWHEIIGWALFAPIFGFIAWMCMVLVEEAALSYGIGGMDNLAVYLSGPILTLSVVYMVRLAFKVGEEL